jgi:hypothetical protein
MDNCGCATPQEHFRRSTVANALDQLNIRPTLIQRQVRLSIG